MLLCALFLFGANDSAVDDGRDKSNEVGAEELDYGVGERGLRCIFVSFDACAFRLSFALAGFGCLCRRACGIFRDGWVEEGTGVHSDRR